MIPISASAARVAMILAVLLATACASGQRGAWRTYQASKVPSDQPYAALRTPAEIAAYPYAQLGVWIDDNRPGVAVLAEYVDDGYRWVAVDGFELVTSKAGRVAGMLLQGSRTRTSVTGDDPIAYVPMGQSVSYRRRVDRDGTVQRVNCTARALPAPDAGQTAVIVTDTCSAAGMPGRSQMTYRFDSKRRMQGAEGQPWPGAPTIRIETLKRPK